MIVAGEASGDLHSARLVRAIRELSPQEEIEFFGAAGPEMRQAGVEAIVEADGISIIGLPEILRAVPMFLRIMRRLVSAADSRRPDAVILVDFPDFNLRLARALKKRGHRVIYYISPQIWAWRRYRIRTLRKYVDLIISILPFEKAWYEKNGVKHVVYVGNPLVRDVHPSGSRAEFCSRHGLDPDRPIIAMLPGSRRAEISRIAPILSETADRMSAANPHLQFVFAVQKGKGNSVAEFLNSKRLLGAKIVEGETYDALAASAAAAVTSGTATLEAALLGVPSAIVYRASRLNYRLLRPLINVEYFGLINLIAGEPIVKEFIQDAFTPENLSAEIFRLLEPETATAIKAKMAAAIERLGSGGASRRAAEAVFQLLAENQSP